MYEEISNARNFMEKEAGRSLKQCCRPAGKDSMEKFEIREYDPTLEQVWVELFVRYAREDLQDTETAEEILRDKIARGLFLKNQEKGISTIALAVADGRPAGFALYQVDSPESDWCRRPGWGLIREFCIVPEFRRRGYGKALAAYAKSKLLEKTKLLYLTAHDAAAMAFWTSCGYRDTGEDDPNGCRIMTLEQRN